MNHKHWRKLAVLGTAFYFSCGMLTPQPAQAQASPPPVEEFFKHSAFSEAKLSPDGKHVAVRVTGVNDRVILVLIDVATNEHKILKHYAKVDIASVDWLNNKRLVYQLSDRKIGDGDEDSGPGLFAIDIDAGDQRQLIERSWGDSANFRQLSAFHFFIDVDHKEGSDDVFIARNGGTRLKPSLSLLKVNTRTGQARIVPTPPDATGYLIDKDGEVRVTTTKDKGIAAVFYKDPKSGDWRKLIEFDPLKESGFSPSFIGPDGSLYVTAHQGHDTTSVYQYDLANNKVMTTPIVTMKGYDFAGSFTYNKIKNKLTGLRYETDASATFWFDDDWKKLQQRVDALLPDTINTISGPSDSAPKVILIHAFSDVYPGAYLLFNIETGKFYPLGETRPGIDQKQMSHMDMIRYKARDGLEIPAYLTLPKGSGGKNLPLVVLVHGGPYVRGGHWGWDSQVQFLASRGYAVLQPEFRGSTGYGSKLWTSGWKQWGLAMQDDITDGTKWAIAQGYADPKRICIAGASYGGYATMMGLIKEPDLYQCGISWVGVSDINLLYDVTWSDASDESFKYGMPTLIGDQKKDAEQLKATSPIEQASRLKKPLILAYGGADVRVPLVHGTKFYDAVKAHNPNVEWIVYADEGHGWRVLKNNVDFWTKVEKFLDQNIGKK
ncbi:S9 family peptidase [Undibacterium sp.]|uniref:S9 family peptidase n=1 Tax=Undibacterium sp. TaxID=1914977 RepID=UPI002CF0802B|nr:alpha/beta fold hydrolase [Undibacterium sp.]HTD06921.1 alpha/beta fold hydrolase [Undibacterium sp.]